MDTFLIKPSDFKLPPLHSKLFVFFNLQHLFMFKEMVGGGKVKSFGPAKKFNFVQNNTEYTAIGGMIGAALSVLNIENAIASGAKNIITFGSAGWIGKEEKAIGSIIAPIIGIDETGVSKDYGNTTDQIQFSMVQEIEAGEKIVSINSFYRTSLEKIKYYRSLGIQLIDMESSPLQYIVPSLGGQIKSVFVVSDRIDPSMKWINGIQNPLFLQGVEKALNQIQQI